MSEEQKEINKLQSSVSELIRIVRDLQHITKNDIKDISNILKDSLMTFAKRIVLAENRIISLTKRIAELEDEKDIKS